MQLIEAPKFLFENQILPMASTDLVDAIGQCGLKRGLSFMFGHVLCCVGAGVNLSGTTDTGSGGAELLFPLGDPTGKTTDGKHNGEHVGGNTNGTHDDTGVKINVGIKFPFDEIIIIQGGCFQLLGDVQQGIIDAQLVEDLVADFL